MKSINLPLADSYLAIDYEICHASFGIIQM